MIPFLVICISTMLLSRLVHPFTCTTTMTTGHIAAGSVLIAGTGGTVLIMVMAKAGTAGVGIAVTTATTPGTILG